MGTPAASATQPDAGWFHGRTPDLLLGAGGAYLLSVPLLLVLDSRIGIGVRELVIAGFLGLVCNTPHYGATLLRVYERGEDRHKYALFALWASAGLALLFFAALHSAWLGALVFSVYLSWSPWHFAGQNYGLALMFLRRRGVDVTPRAKRRLQLSFVLSFALALVVMHTGDSTATFAPLLGADADSYGGPLRLGIPIDVSALLLPALSVLYLGALFGTATELRTATTRDADLAPAALLVLSQALWFVLPAWFQATGQQLALPFTILYVSIAHSVQYLWVTSYYAKRENPSERVPGYFGKALLAGSAINFLPGLLFAPALLGTVSWNAGLGVLVFSIVNLHHFILDGAVWKLRDGRVAQALLRDGPPPGGPAERPRGARGWLRPALLAAGAACLAIPVIQLLDDRTYSSRDLDRVEAAATRLRWVGRDSAEVLGNLAGLYAGRDRLDDAEATYRRALAVRPSPVLLNNTAWFLAARRGEDPERARESVVLAEAALAAFGARDFGALDTLAVAYAAAGRFSEAIENGSRAAALAREAGQDDVAAVIDAHVARFRRGRSIRD